MCAMINDKFALTVKDLNSLRWYKAQHDNALALIRMRGVPEQRARYMAQALDVLLTRLDREIHALRDEQRETSDALGWMHAKCCKIVDNGGHPGEVGVLLELMEEYFSVPKQGWRQRADDQSFDDLVASGGPVEAMEASRISSESDPTMMLIRDIQRMKGAGTEMAEAAGRVVNDYDGLHRLSLAVSAWWKALADEGDRSQLFAEPGQLQQYDPWEGLAAEVDSLGRGQQQRQAITVYPAQEREHIGDRLCESAAWTAYLKARRVWRRLLGWWWRS